MKLASRSFPYTSGLTLDYENDNYQEGYKTLFEGIAKTGIDIHYNDYKWGYNLFAFDLSPDLFSGEHFSLLKDGSLDLAINFSKAKSITSVYYLE